MAYLVCTDNEDNVVHVPVGAQLLLHLSQPRIQSVKRLLLSNIIDQDDSLRVLVKLIPHLQEQKAKAFLYQQKLGMQYLYCNNPRPITGVISSQKTNPCTTEKRGTKCHIDCWGDNKVWELTKRPICMRQSDDPGPATSFRHKMDCMSKPPRDAEES